jgi:hypothetical protein
VAATAVHPGASAAGGADQCGEQSLGRTAALFKTIPQGAATRVWVAAGAKAENVGGRSCEDCDVAALVVDPANRKGVEPCALDPERAKALRAKSEPMVGEPFA